MFEESILPTHRSKFVQFVLFFASGRSPGLGHALTSKLLEVLRDEKRPKVLKKGRMLGWYDLIGTYHIHCGSF